MRTSANQGLAVSIGDTGTYAKCVWTVLRPRMYTQSLLIKFKNLPDSMPSCLLSTGSHAVGATRPYGDHAYKPRCGGISRDRENGKNLITSSLGCCTTFTIRAFKTFVRKNPTEHAVSGMNKICNIVVYHLFLFLFLFLESCGREGAHTKKAPCLNGERGFVPHSLRLQSFSHTNGRVSVQNTRDTVTLALFCFLASYFCYRLTLGRKGRTHYFIFAQPFKGARD